ncbi:MAG: BACON domain-containing protein, partial [Treponema sp.]|nr:BACON domain-containing protein [Treponema sp.]
MKKLPFLLIPLLALLTFGCPNPNNPADQTSLKVGENSLVFDETGGSKLVAVSGDVDWIAASNQTWCSVSPDHGNGGGAINIIADLNNTVVLRTAKITVKTTDGKISNDITITQAAGQQTGKVSDSQGHSIDASPPVLDFLNIAGSKTITVTSNVAWQITSDQIWCSVSVLSGSSAQVTVDVNTGTSSRIARLSIINSEYALTTTVVVTQLGIQPSIVILPPQKQDITAEAQTITFGVSANVEFGAVSGVNWINVTQVTPSTVTLQVQENTVKASRTGMVTLKQTNGSVSAAFTVNQAAKPPAVYYVSSYASNDSYDGKSWDYPVKNISTVIQRAADGDQVWVEEGTYTETVVMKDGVNVYGGFSRNDKSIAERGTRRSIILNSDFSMTNNYTNPTIIDGFDLNTSSAVIQTIYQNVTMNNCKFSYQLRVYGGTISNSTISINLPYSLLITINSGGKVLNSRIMVEATTTNNGNLMFLDNGRLEGCIISGSLYSTGSYPNYLIGYISNNNNIVNCTFH